MMGNGIISKRVLFGTDFYVVSQKESEKSLFHNLRGYLVPEMFKQIAYYNPKKYLVI